MLNPLNKNWGFESKYGCDAELFELVLEMFHISPYFSYIPSYLDFSEVKFRTTKKKKEQIECVYKRFLEGKEMNYVIY